MPINKLNCFKIFILAILIFLFLSPQINMASAQDAPDAEVNIYFFWGDGCPHCEVAKPILEGIAESDPRIGYHAFEVYHIAENRDLFYEFGEAFGMEPQGVPTIFVADRYWVGFSENIQAEISQTIDLCLETSCTDLGRELLGSERRAPAEKQSVTRPVLIILGIVLGLSLIIFAGIQIIKPKNKIYKYKHR